MYHKEIEKKITETLKGVSPTPSFLRLSCQHTPFSCFFAKKIEALLMKYECVRFILFKFIYVSL